MYTVFMLCSLSTSLGVSYLVLSYYEQRNTRNRVNARVREVMQRQQMQQQP